MNGIVTTQGAEVLSFAGYQEFASAADRTAVKIKEGFMEMGYLLKIARDTDILRGSEYRSCEEFADKRYGLDKGTVSRYIRIVERFSVGGNSHILQDGYRNVGFAKLSLMLHLSDEVAEELMDRYSKAEVQMVKEEIEAEQAISEIELAIEKAEKAETDTEEQRNASMLELAVRQLGREQPDLYRKLWHIKRTHSANVVSPLLEAFAPDGSSIHMARIPGIGRLMLSISESEDNPVSVINIRSNAKEKFDTNDLAAAVDVIINTSVASADESYREVYSEPIQEANEEKSKVAPVQPAKEKRKQSKVVKARPREQQPAAAVQPEPQKPEEDEIPGQISVEYYPEILPVNYEEIKEGAEDAADESSEEGNGPNEAENGSNEAAGGTDAYNQGSVSGNEKKILSDTEVSSNKTAVVDVVSGGLRTTGNAGTSRAASDQEPLDEVPNKTQENLEQLLDELVDAAHEVRRLIGNWIYDDWGDMDIEKVREAYESAIDWAAAVEKVLILKQCEAQNG